MGTTSIDLLFISIIFGRTKTDQSYYGRVRILRKNIFMNRFYAVEKKIFRK